MSTTILDTHYLGVARVASWCDRCVEPRGRCVQFIVGHGAHTYTLCLKCFEEFCAAVKAAREFDR